MYTISVAPTVAEGIFSPGAEQGSQFEEGRCWVSLSREHVQAGNRGWVLVTCPLKLFERGLENFVVGDRVVIIEVVVYRSFLIIRESLYGIEVNAFCLKM